MASDINTLNCQVKEVLTFFLKKIKRYLHSLNNHLDKVFFPFYSVGFLICTNDVDKRLYFVTHKTELDNFSALN